MLEASFLFYRRSRILRWFANRPGPRRWFLGMCAAGLSWFAMGCGHYQSTEARIRTPELPIPEIVARAAPPEAEYLPPPKPIITLEPFSTTEPQTHPKTIGPVNVVVPMPQPSPSLPASARVLPLSLETIFRLAEEQNPQVRLAREQVTGACADLDVARNSWLPKIYAGPAYYRHEGGIQDQDGRLIHSSTGALFAGVEINAQCDLRDATFQRVRAERELWQQKGELSRITNVTLLAASSAYMDLVTARTGEAVVRTIDKRLRDLLRQAESLGQNVPQAPVEAIRAEVHANQMIILKMRQLADASSARLAYLLGVCAGTQFEPVDATLAPFALVDATPCLEVLVARAAHSGPGVRDLEGMVDLLQGSLSKVGGPMQYMPVIELRMAEGGFGAGQGSAMDWDNRWDMGLQARWNVGAFLTAQQQHRSAESRITQAHLALEDLRAKLSAGVQEARETIHNTGYQIRQGQQQIDHCEKSFGYLNEVLQSIPQKDRQLGDVMRSLMLLKQAQQDYLMAINSYDKAQLRLLLLLGPLGPRH